MRAKLSQFLARREGVPRGGVRAFEIPIIFEGWMLGFEPVRDTSKFKKPLEDVNTLLYDYKPWWDEIDYTIFLEPNDVRDVIDWRIEAEERMKTYGKAGMSKADTKTYVEKFMVAYETYLPGMREKVKSRQWVDKSLHLKINKYRDVIIQS